MKSLIKLCLSGLLVFIQSLAFAVKKNVVLFSETPQCNTPTQNQKDLIYSALDIPPDVSFSLVCNKIHEDLANKNGIFSIPENTPRVYKTLGGPVSWACGISCGVSMALGFIVKPTSAETSIARIKEQSPYSNLQGGTFTYRFGGGEWKQYSIGSVNDYNFMLEDIRTTLNFNNMIKNGTMQTIQLGTCSCWWSIPF